MAGRDQSKEKQSTQDTAPNLAEHSIPRNHEAIPRDHEARSLPLSIVVRRDSLISIEMANPLRGAHIPLFVKRFSAGIEVAAFSMVIDRKDAITALTTAESAWRHSSGEQTARHSTATEFLPHLAAQLQALGYRWEQETLDAGTIVKFGAVSFGVIPNSIESLAKDPVVWGRESVKRQDRRSVLGIAAEPSERPGKWDVTVTDIYKKRNATVHMSQDRYQQFKVALTRDVGVLSNRELIERFNFSFD